MNSIPPVTKNLLIINLLFFLGIFVAEKYGINLRSELGLHFFMAEDFSPYQLLTYMFMHGNLEHKDYLAFLRRVFERVFDERDGLHCGVEFRAYGLVELPD